MRHTRETVRRHLSPWVLLIWAALVIIAAVLDHNDVLPVVYIEEVEE